MNRNANNQYPGQNNNMMNGQSNNQYPEQNNNTMQQHQGQMRGQGQQMQQLGNKKRSIREALSRAGSIQRGVWTLQCF